MARAHKFWKLQPADRRLLVNAFLAIAAARVRLALLPFRAGKGYLRSRKAGSAEAWIPDRIAWAVDVASRNLGNATCLARALAAHGMLASRGFSSCVSIGVAAGEESGPRKGLIAHAWLEFGGRILLGGPDVGRYIRLLQWCN